MAHLEPLDPQSLEVKISELLVATADGHDPDLDRAISEVLLLLRRQLRMDVVFVSEFVDGERVFRFMRGGEVLGLHEGDSAPLESSYCQQVVTGRMPELVTDAADLVARGELPDTGLPIGAHLSTPVVLPDGSERKIGLIRRGVRSGWDASARRHPRHLRGHLRRRRIEAARSRQGGAARGHRGHPARRRRVGGGRRGGGGGGVGARAPQPQSATPGEPPGERRVGAAVHHVRVNPRRE